MKLTKAGLRDTKTRLRNLYNALKQCVCALNHFSCVRLFATPLAVALQYPLSMGFSWEEYWSGLPFPTPGIFLTQGLNLLLLSPALQVDSLPLSHGGSPLRWSTEIKFVRKTLVWGDLNSSVPGASSRTSSLNLYHPLPTDFSSYKQTTLRHLDKQTSKSMC